MDSCLGAPVGGYWGRQGNNRQASDTTASQRVLRVLRSGPYHPAQRYRSLRCLPSTRPYSPYSTLQYASWLHRVRGILPSAMYQSRSNLISFYLWERHDVGEHLGSGSYGNVFRARQKHSGQTVAVKIIRNVDRPTICHRTLYEIKILQHLKHRIIVSVLDVIASHTFENFSEVCVVEEYMDQPERIFPAPLLKTHAPSEG